MSVRSNVNCSWCNKMINRVTWNYEKNRQIENFFCDTSCKGEWQRSQRESEGYTKEWLHEQYHVLGKSANQIGKEINKDSKSVWWWMKGYGMKTRPRGHNPPPRTPSGKDNPFYGKKHSKETKQKIRKARLEDGRIPCMKDGVHYMHHEDFNPEDHPSWKGGITPERQALYASEEWSEAVKAVWARDNAICQRCGKKHNTKTSRGTFHIHHIVSFAVKEKRTDVDNLILLCRKCHLWVHSNKNTNKDFIQEIENDS